MPKNSSVEEDVRGVAVGRLLPPRRDQMLVLPEGLEDPCIETDVARGLEARELLFALDAPLAVLQHRLEPNGGEVDLGENETTLILFLDLPVVADELGGVELLRAVDLDDLRLANDDTSTVLQECCEVLAGFARVIDNTLENISINSVPVCIVRED